MYDIAYFCVCFFKFSVLFCNCEICRINVALCYVEVVDAAAAFRYYVLIVLIDTSFTRFYLNDYC